MDINPPSRNSWTVWYVICLHWLWGALLLSSPAPLNITAINSLTHFGFISSSYVGVLFLVVAFLAAISRATPKAVSIFFILPQQLVLLVSAVGAVTAMISGTFADGVVRSVPFLIADQAPAVLIAAFHILSVYKDYLFPEKPCLPTLTTPPTA